MTDQTKQQQYTERSASAWGVLRAKLLLLNHIDQENHEKANYVIAGTGIVLAVALSQLNIEESATGITGDLINVGWLVIAFASLLALLFSMVAVQPMKPTKDRDKERVNLYWPGSYLPQLSREEYARRLKETMQSDDMIIEEMAHELYDYSNDEIMPKLKKVKFATYVFVTGLAAGIVFIAFGMFVV